MFGKADMLSHLSRESCLPGMSISNCSFPNKDGVGRTMTLQNTQHILDEELIQSLSMVFGTKSEVRLYIFPCVPESLGPLHTPDAVTREDTVTPLLRCRCRNSERCADLPHITQR